MGAIELKPCPFCGGEAKLYRMPTLDGFPYKVGCNEVTCPIHVFTVGMCTKEEAIEAWNRRVSE